MYLEICMFPNLPSTVSLFYKNKKGAKDIKYTHRQLKTPTGKLKWNKKNRKHKIDNDWLRI